MFGLTKNNICPSDFSEPWCSHSFAKARLNDHLNRFHRQVFDELMNRFGIQVFKEFGDQIIQGTLLITLLDNLIFRVPRF